MNTPYKQLYRSQSNRMLGGVCAGLGDFFGIDPTLVRLGFVIGALLGWAGALVVAYIIMLIVVPEAPLTAPTNAPVQPETPAEASQ